MGVALPVRVPVRVSARGVLAGILVGIALTALLVALGAAIGVTAFPHAIGRSSGIAISVWLVLSFAAAAFGGAWTAAGGARALRRRDGVLQGIVTWAAMTILGTPMVGSMMRDVIRSGLAGDPSLVKLAAWGAFAVPAIGLGAAILGGLVAVARERRVVRRTAETR